MSGWPGKYVIGLTGNIATGKSVVRKMLEHLGAYGIDADALGHRAIAKGAPGYQPVLDTFGRWILDREGQIDRVKLARLVFSNPDALSRLEAIVHPLVGQAVDILIRRSSQNVIVIEAIKLIESELIARCDSLWVSVAQQEVQLARLMKKRGMDESTARQRIQSQPDPEQKVALANVIIRNEGSYEETWAQVLKAWQAIFPSPEPAVTQPAKALRKGEMAVQRARPRQAAEIALLINRLNENQRKLTPSDVMASFGEKAFILLTVDNEPAGVVGLKVENLVSRIDDIYIEKNLPIIEAMRLLVQEVERASRDLQCEAALMFLPDSFPNQEALASQLGYVARSVQGLGVRAWQEAAIESMPANSILFFKQLRQDRVLRPV
jgi:dephospho-CoA kinase